MIALVRRQILDDGYPHKKILELKYGDKDPFLDIFSAKQTTSQKALHVYICGLSIPNSRVRLDDY